MGGRKRTAKLSAADGQPSLRLVHSVVDFEQNDNVLLASILKLTEVLVQVPSQGGMDSQRQVIDELVSWYDEHGVVNEPVRAPNRAEHNSYIGMISEIGSGEPPYFLMTACLDTAPFGRKDDWSFKPTSGQRDSDGWMYGRGVGDSKVAISIFSHIVASLRDKELSGTIVFLADSDEHTGRFGAVKEIVERRYKKGIQGAVIGYPGFDQVKSGARGFYRIGYRFFGTSAHTGSRRHSSDNAITKAVSFCSDIERLILPKEPSGAFHFGPKITVTSIKGGERSFSNVPDTCEVLLDVRLTPHFQKKQAADLISGCIKKNVAEFGGRAPQPQKNHSWPAYQLSDESAVLKAATESYREVLGREPHVDVCGPSNVGNYLASQGIDAICGFGVECENIHAANERIKIETVLPVYKVYKRMAEAFFTHY